MLTYTRHVAHHVSTSDRIFQMIDHSPLLRLPPELRLDILDHLVPYDGTVDLTRLEHCHCQIRDTLCWTSGLIFDYTNCNGSRRPRLYPPQPNRRAQQHLSKCLECSNRLMRRVCLDGSRAVRTQQHLAGTLTVCESSRQIRDEVMHALHTRLAYRDSFCSMGKHVDALRHARRVTLNYDKPWKLVLWKVASIIPGLADWLKDMERKAIIKEISKLGEVEHLTLQLEWGFVRLFTQRRGGSPSLIDILSAKDNENSDSETKRGFFSRLFRPVDKLRSAWKCPKSLRTITIMASHHDNKSLMKVKQAHEESTSGQGTESAIMVHYQESQYNEEGFFRSRDCFSWQDNRDWVRQPPTPPTTGNEVQLTLPLIGGQTLPYQVTGGPGAWP